MIDGFKSADPPGGTPHDIASSHERSSGAPAQLPSSADALPTMRDHAVRYGQAGVKIFPCRSQADGRNREKTRLIPGWQHAATSDVAQIERLWSIYPDAGIGMPTGEINGVDVLDLDVKNGKNGIEALWSLSGCDNLDVTVASRTPNGGFHLFFQHREGVRNAVDRIGAGIDVRGDGGYVILPPSQIHAGAYEWCEGFAPDLNRPMAESASLMPEVLYAKMKKKDRDSGQLELNPGAVPADGPPADQVAVQGSVKRRADAAYLQQVVSAECSALACCSQGQNHRLNAATFAISQLLHTYDFYHLGQAVPFSQARDWALSQLWEAARSMVNLDPNEPWTDAEIEPTIRSGWTAGVTVPHKGSPNDPLAGSTGTALGPTRPHSTSTLQPAPLPLVPPTLEEITNIDLGFVANLHGKEPKPIEYAIFDLMPQRVVTLLSGEGGVGKSMIGMQAMASVAAGTEFYGKAVNQGAVVAVFAEDGERVTHKRLLRLVEEMKITLRDIPNVNIIDFERNNQDPILSTTKAITPKRSSTCGKHCITFGRSAVQYACSC